MYMKTHRVHRIQVDLATNAMSRYCHSLLVKQSPWHSERHDGLVDKEEMVLYEPATKQNKPGLCNASQGLTYWGRVTHICVGKLTIIDSDNGLSPDRRQAITWTNAGLLLIGPIGTNFSEILIEILTFSFKKMRLKVSSAKRRPFCLGLNVLSAQFAFCCVLWWLGT